MLHRSLFTVFLASTALCATPALAQMAQPVRDMVNAAIATGDAETVNTVIAIARTTNPDDVAELNAMLAAFERSQAEQEASAAAAEELAIREAGIFDNWSGEGQLGGFLSTGNTESSGVSAALALERSGINWEHLLRAGVDYQRTEGVTVREQFIAAYEPRYSISERLFAYGLAQYERDRFQGFTSRYSGSGGLGYRVIVEENMQLSVKGGPAWRQTDFIDGSQTSNLAALAAVDFDWQISDTIALTHDSSAIIDADNTTLAALTGVEASLSDAFTARLSYGVEYDSNPPLGAVSTDTLSRLTLIYGF